MENLTRDLFGDVCTLPSGRRGRPAHRWSQSNNDRVIIGLALGYSDAEIASGLGVSVPTLKKYYFSTALKMRAMQRARYELWRAQTLAAQANDGNVSAMRELQAIFDARDRKTALRRMTETQENAPQRLGKKEVAEQAAVSAGEGTEWGDDLKFAGGKPERPN